MRIRSNQPGGISLREVLPAAEFVGATDIRVRACSAGACHCRPGDLAALPRSEPEAARRAARRGAAAVLTESPWGCDSLPTCVVADVRQAYGRVCQALVGNPARDLKVIGVAGSNHKTVSSFLIASVLAAAGNSTGVCGALGYGDGVGWAPLAGGAPSAAELALWLARCRANHCSHAVLEVPSAALRERTIAGVEFDAVAVTGMRWGDGAARDGRTVQRLFDCLRPEGFTVVNADGPGYEPFCPRCVPELTVGIDSPAEVSATSVEETHSEQTFLLTLGHETAPVRTTLVGRDAVHGCLLAAAVASVYGIDLTTIARGLEAVPRIPGRLDRLECGQAFGVFIDAGNSPAALETALRTLRRLTVGRLICVAAEPRNESARGQIEHVLERYGDAASVVRRTSHRQSAIRWALDQARPGDCVLIAGARESRFPFRPHGRPRCDDREFARKLLSEAPRRELFPLSA